GPARIAEAAIDKDNQTFRLREPLPVARGPIKREKSAGHGYIVSQVRPCCIVRAMTEPSIRKGSIGQYPAGGLKGLITSIGVASRSIEVCQGRDGPSIFTGIHVLVDARQAKLAALGIIEGIVAAAVLAFDQIGILAGIESAFRRSKKCFQITPDILRGIQVRGIVPLRIGQ